LNRNHSLGIAGIVTRAFCPQPLSKQRLLVKRLTNGYHYHLRADGRNRKGGGQHASATVINPEPRVTIIVAAATISVPDTTAVCAESFSGCLGE
jgi:hypothetical protein